MLLRVDWLLRLSFHLKEVVNTDSAGATFADNSLQGGVLIYDYIAVVLVNLGKSSASTVLKQSRS